MAIVDRPTTIRTYYKSMIAAYKTKLDLVNAEINKQSKELIKLHEELLENKDIYKNKFKIILTNYKEFNDNTYITGEFYKTAKGLYLNKKDNYIVVAELYDLYNCANIQKTIYDLNKNKEFYKKLINIKFDTYTDILRAYYSQIHKELILNGNGYAFGNGIGWICINRCKIRKKVRKLDYKATREKEAQLKAEGKRIWNKEEAEWCLKHGIEYKAHDKRVYLTGEYYYEIPLIGSKLPGGNKLKLETTDYRSANLRGKSNEQLINESNNDTNNICNLQLDIKTKLTLCNKINKILYTKFIRNEAQKPVAYTTSYSEDR